MQLAPPLRDHFPTALKKSALCVFTLVSLASASVQAENAAEVASPVSHSDASVVRNYIEQYTADKKSIAHRYRIPLDERGVTRELENAKSWLTKLQRIDFDTLDRVGKTDYLLLRSELEYQIDLIQLEQERDQEAQQHIPFSPSIVDFLRKREDVEPIVAREVATELNRIADSIEEHRGLMKPKGSSNKSTPIKTRLSALRASELLQRLQRSVREADGFYRGYDPQYTWWNEKPMERLDKAMEAYRRTLRESVVGVPDSDKDTIIGQPIGAEGLALELKHEWIAHSPSELVALAKREMKWCDDEMEKASRELGFGADWRAAMEHVKSKHVEPGDQPAMIRDLAWEAIRFLEANDLVTVPPLAATGWRMTMMSPERQRVNPYFLGGDTIIVSFPTNTMTHEEKLMSMRSNNEHFSRATVHHELIPGHHLQFYMLPRHRPYRSLFRTPFWIEGWALYWEMLLWDLDFAQSAEDRVGMLFWRKHRCARIIFSLSYHLGEMSPEECVEYLVQRVGHEQSAAQAEVRRSIMGGYSPLYQAAYMLGGLQLRELHRELVLSGKMTNREFHDAVLHEHSIPIEVLRAYLTEQEVTSNQSPSWRFATSTAETGGN